MSTIENFFHKTIKTKNMKKATLLLMGLTFWISFANAQINNYDANGKKTKAISEKIVLNVSPRPGTLPNAGVIPGIITGLLGATGDVLKTILSNRDASFTATYTGKYTGNNFLNSDNFNLGTLTISRFTSDDGSVPSNLQAQYVLEFIPDNGVFRLHITQIVFNSAKARIKKGGKNGNNVDVSLDIQISAQYKGVNKDDPQSYSLQNVNLGESTIVIPGLKPTGAITVNSTDNSLYSNWYQSIPAAPAAMLSEHRGDRGWYSITVTVKEANSSALSSNKVSSFLESNSGDISTVLKALVPASK